MPAAKNKSAKKESKTRREAGGPAAAALAKVRRACLALPDTTEKIAWGSPTFRVGGRLFVMFMDHHHGDGRLAIWCNAAEGAQEAFVTSDPERYFIPPYVGPSGWLGVRLDRGLALEEVSRRIRAAHQATVEEHAAKQAARRGRARAAGRNGARRSR
jgi:hypothetical protein